ncbi:MAG: hypothetical protein JWN98_694, partial [Abditibacteriota bacterium]|nr:hypothetical protein [Abditibacteriota bacterium]
NWLNSWQDALLLAQDAIFDFVGAHLVTVCLIGAALSAILLWMWRLRRGIVLRIELGAINSETLSPADMAARRAIFDVYRKLSKKLGRRFRPISPWETPREWSLQAMNSLNLREPAPLHELTDLYARAKYSPHPLGHKEVEAARTAWQNFSWEARPATEEKSVRSLS